jgi:hypothetical protein
VVSLQPRERAAVVLLVLVVALAAAMKAVLRAPGIPYNVAELFLDDGSLLVLVIFALALLWLGAGPALLAQWLLRTRRPYLVLPVGVLLIALVSRTLLKYSVTYESLDDILGTSNLFERVTQGNVWGDSWRHAFLTTNMPNLVEFFERRVRYLGLYSPLAVCLTACLLPLKSPIAVRQRPPSGVILLTGVLAAALVWLSKCIVVDWAATDNLTELIAEQGPFGLGGVPYLALILLVMALNVSAILLAVEGRAPLTVALACSIAGIPIGWALLTLGLEQHIAKYGVVFSGQQFLLGPDRQHTLGNGILFIRWVAAQVGLIATMAAGAWVARAFLRGRQVT